jgi:TolB-like protein/tetratricopeptide (TPR) repeat protein
VFVETISGKGYRFVAPVTIADSRPHAPATECISVAVLPFENLTGDPNQEYLSDGLTEETIAALGNLAPERLTVIARTSVMRYKRTRKTAREIAGEIGVDYLLESTFRRDEQAVRITARLVRARDQAQVWSGSYDRDWRSVLQLQEELGRAIAQHVQIGFTPKPAIAHPRQTTFDPDAYDLYLRGMHHRNQRRPTALRRAIECFEAAVSKDPGFALAWSGLADTYSVLPLTSDGDPAELWPKARHAADEAVRLQSALAESWTSSGGIAFWLDWDWCRAEKDLRRAVLLNPSYATVHHYLAIVLSNLGRHTEALAIMGNARRLDPLSPVLRAVSGQLFFQARNFEQAEGQARQALALNSDFWLGHLFLGKVYERTQRSAAALTEFDIAFQLSEGNTEALSLKGYTMALMGRRTESVVQSQVVAIERHSAPRTRGVHTPKCGAVIRYVIEEARLVQVRPHGPSIDLPIANPALHSRPVKALSYIRPFANGYQPTRTVIQFLAPQLKNNRMIPFSCAQLNKRLLEVELLLVDRPRPASPERFQTAL